MQMKGHGEKRSRKAEQFIAALLSHPSMKLRLMRDPGLAGQYRTAKREVIRQTTARLQQAARDALECLVNITKWPDRGDY